MRKFDYLLLSAVLFIIISSIGCCLYSLKIQIEFLTLEIKNLTTFIEILKSNEIELKNLLSIKDKQILSLITTINQLEINITNLADFNNIYNLESFKQEIIKANTTKLTEFYLNSAKIVAATVLFSVGAIFIKKTFFSEFIELNYVDNINKLMWVAEKTSENQNMKFLVKKIDPDFLQHQWRTTVETVVLKTPESFLRGSPEGVELVCLKASALERTMAASQIADVLSSVGVY